MVEYARGLGGDAMETAFDLLMLLPLAYTPKKMAEPVFSAFVAQIMQQKGFDTATSRYVPYFTKNFL